MKKALTLRITALYIIILSMFINLKAQESGCPAAYAQFEQEQYEAAIQSYTICLASYPNDFFAYYNRGRCYEEMGLFEKAESDYWTAFQIEPAFIEPLKRLTEVHMLENDFETALNVANRAIEITDGEAPATYNYRGYILFSQGKYRSAFRDFTQAIELDSNYAAAYNNRASARYNMQNIAAASEKDLLLSAQDYKKALSLDSSQTGIWRNLAYIYLLLENYESSLKLLNKAIAESPEDPMLYRYKGQALRKTGRHQAALESFSKVLQLNSDFHASRLERAEIYLENRSWDQLEQDIAVLKSAPEIYRAKAAFLEAQLYLLKDQDKVKALKALKNGENWGLFETKENILKLKNAEVFEPLKGYRKYQKWLDKL